MTILGLGNSIISEDNNGISLTSMRVWENSPIYKSICKKSEQTWNPDFQYGELTRISIPIYGSLETQSEEALLDQKKKDLEKNTDEGDPVEDRPEYEAKRHRRIWQEIINTSKGS